MSQYKTPCLLFDSECPLCKRFKMSLERVELQGISLSYYDIQDEGIYQAFPFLNIKRVNEEIHLVLSDKPPKVIHGAEVLKFLIDKNPKIQKFSWLIDSDMGQKAVNTFYSSVNSLRTHLRSHCSKCKNKGIKSHIDPTP